VQKILVLLVFLTLGSQLFAIDRKTNSETISLLREKFNLPSIKFDFNRNEIAIQADKYSSLVSFKAAAIEAMRSFLYDTHNTNSLLSTAIRDTGEPEVKTYINSIINNPGTSFGIYHEDSSESLTHNWIFYISSESLKLNFWAVVDRKGEKPTYNFGSQCLLSNFPHKQPALTICL
jgi:hypothetical protein